jgi:hypothetical protein
MPAPAAKRIEPSQSRWATQIGTWRRARIPKKGPIGRR